MNCNFGRNVVFCRKAIGNFMKNEYIPETKELGDAFERMIENQVKLQIDRNELTLRTITKDEDLFADCTLEQIAAARTLMARYVVFLRGAEGDDFPREIVKMLESHYISFYTMTLESIARQTAELATKNGNRKR